MYTKHKHGPLLYDRIRIANGYCCDEAMSETTEEKWTIKCSVLFWDAKQIWAHELNARKKQSVNNDSVLVLVYIMNWRVCFGERRNKESFCFLLLRKNVGWAMCFLWLLLRVMMHYSNEQTSRFFLISASHEFKCLLGYSHFLSQISNLPILNGWAHPLLISIFKTDLFQASTKRKEEAKCVWLRLSW